METDIYPSAYYAPAATGSAGRRSARLAADYLSLLKPRVVLLHLFTAASAMFLAAGGMPSLKTLALVLAGGGLAAGAANSLNCYFDRELDRSMPRTRGRPLPAGRLSPRRALILGIVCGAAGLALLAWISLAASALALAALAFYAFVYTLWLKRNTSLSAVFSSGIGAVPPLVGWVAVTGRLSATPMLLFAIIALWTPPHFWALAIARGNEYREAGLRVLPEVRPVLWITAFVAGLVAASLVLIPAAMLGVIYIATASTLGSIYLLLALKAGTNNTAGAARTLYLYSMLYLVLLFAAMIADRIILH
jgi:protoheme IX farnesyltransferase